MADWDPKSFNMPEPPKESAPPPAMYKMPMPPSPPNENDAIKILAQAAINFTLNPILSEIPAINKAFAEEKAWFEKNNLAVYDNPAIRYTVVARYLGEKTLPKKGGKKTHKRYAKARKTRRHRSM